MRSKNSFSSIFTFFPPAHVGYSYNASPDCGGAYPKGQCFPCQKVGVLISFWLRYTPEFQLIVMILSAPVTLLVSLWGMFGKMERAILYASFSKYSALPRKGSTDENDCENKAAP